MCKLCNTDKPSIKPRKNSEYHNIVYDYIGEYCCTQCNKALMTAVYLNKDLDRIILYKLYHAYRGFKTNSLGNAKNSQLVTTTSTLGIRVRAHQTQKTSYIATLTIDSKQTNIGSFNTLKEALEAKLAYCTKHNHIRAIKHIQNKLKELQCQN